MEILWLIELLSILGSLLICMDILLSGPASVIPKGWVHNVATAIIDEHLSWAIQIGFICHVRVNIQRLLHGKLFAWVSSSVNLAWMFLWVDITSSESGLVWSIVCMICWMSVGHCSQAISPGGGMKSIILLWNQALVKTDKYLWIKGYTYPVELIVWTGSSIWGFVNTSLLCSVILFCKRELALRLGTYPWYLGITQFFLSTDLPYYEEWSNDFPFYLLCWPYRYTRFYTYFLMSTWRIQAPWWSPVLCNYWTQIWF